MNHPPLAVGTMTKTPIKVLNLMKLGKTDKEIAVILFISPRTVTTHCRNIYRELGARNRAHAVYLALKRGLIKIDEGKEDIGDLIKQTHLLCEQLGLDYVECEEIGNARYEAWVG